MSWTYVVSQLVIGPTEASFPYNHNRRTETYVLIIIEVTFIISGIQQNNNCLLYTSDAADE